MLIRDKNIALFTAGVLGIFPLFLRETVSSLSPHTMAIPILLACLYYYLSVRRDEKKLPFLLGLIVLFPFIHPGALFFITGLFFYGLLVLTQGYSLRKIEWEIFLFSVLYEFWIIFLLFKKAFLFHGFSIIWQNIPAAILNNYFEPLSLLTSVGAIGVLPLLFGISLVFKYLSQRGEQEWFLFIGFAFSFFFLISFKLVEPKIGLLYLGVFLFLLCGKFFHLSFFYLEKTKISSYTSVLVPSFIVFFVLSLFLFSPSPQNNAPSLALLHGLQWIHQHASPDTTVLGTIEQGHLIVAEGMRKNVWDSSFLFVPSANQRVNDVIQIFQTSSEVTALALLHKYKVGYILFSRSAQLQFDVPLLPYVRNEKCFSKVYENEEVSVYKVLCMVREL